MVVDDAVELETPASFATLANDIFPTSKCNTIMFPRRGKVNGNCINLSDKIATLPQPCNLKPKRQRYLLILGGLAYPWPRETSHPIMPHYNCRGFAFRDKITDVVLVN